MWPKMRSRLPSEERRVGNKGRGESTGEAMKNARNSSRSIIPFYVLIIASLVLGACGTGGHLIREAQVREHAVH